MEYSDDTPLFSSDAIIILFAFIICVDCAKEPEYRCENCDKVYKQESRYNTHKSACVVGGDPREVSSVAVATVATASDFSELLRQNREMMDLMRQQQETIQLLVAQLIPRGGGGG